MGRRFTFPLLRVTLFICWISLLLTFQSSFGSNNTVFPDASQANFKVALIPNSLFRVSVYNFFEHGFDINFETQLIKFSRIPFLGIFSSRKGDIKTDKAIYKINFPVTNNRYNAAILSTLRMEKYTINTISVFLYVSDTAHFYTPI